MLSRVFAKPKSLSPMQVDVKSVAALFESQSELVLPFFQRGYAWQVEHAERLLDDVLKALDGELQVDWYPLGNIILARTSTASERILIADGQQRLTTLTILVAVLRDLLPADSAVRARLARLVASGLESDPTGREYRLQASQLAGDALQRFVQRDGSTRLAIDEEALDLSESASNVIENRNRLRSRLDGAPRARLEAVATYLMERCFLSLQIVANEALAVLLFETMHDRGLRPATVDLLKAEILNAVPPEAIDACRSIWDNLEVRLDREGMEKLLGYVALIETRNAASTSFESSLRSVIDFDNPREVLAFVTDRLGPLGAHFIALREAAQGVQYAETEAARRLQYMHWVRNHDTWAAVALLWLDVSKATMPEAAEFMRRLEALAWVQMITTPDIVRRNARYLKVMEEIDAGIALADNGALAIRPAERELVRTTLSNSNIMRRRYKQFLMLRLNAAIEGDGAVATVPTATIEHVYPKNPDQASQWMVDFASQSDAGRLVDQLGNLTLLTAAEQHMAQNHDFVFKRRVFQDSVFKMSQVAGESFSWRPVDVRARTRELVALLMRSWGLA